MAKYYLIFIVPFVFLICGIIMQKKPPENINSVYGYRTARSMRDKQSWDLAQKQMSVYFILYAVVSLTLGVVLALLCRFLFDKDYMPCVILLLQTFGIFSIIFIIENNLKKMQKIWDNEKTEDGKKEKEE